jgi:hypothetical protein
MVSGVGKKPERRIPVLKGPGEGGAGGTTARRMLCGATEQVLHDGGPPQSAAVTFHEDLDPESGVTLKRTLVWDRGRVEHCQTCSLSAEFRHPEHRVSVPRAGSWTTELSSPASPLLMRPKAMGESVIIPADHRYAVRNSRRSECISILLAPRLRYPYRAFRLPYVLLSSDSVPRWLGPTFGRA